jgi:hypothetical protein
MPSQMNGSNVSYSAAGELKKAQTCRCWRRVDRPKGMASAIEFISASWLGLPAQLKRRRIVCVATMVTSPI